MQGLLLVLALLFIVLTALPLVRHSYWVIRACDFPRLQITLAGFGMLGVYVAFWDVTSVTEGVVLAGLVVATGWQAAWLRHYTPLYAPQVEDATDARPHDAMRLLVANVYIDNRNPAPFFDLVERTDPDVILTLEADAFWADALHALDDAYPHVLYHPLDNAYGITFHSRLPLTGAEIRFIVADDLPSVFTQIDLPSGRTITFHGVHPRPPHPEEAEDTIDRDAELLIVAHEVEDELDDHAGTPVVVAGDFNDVPWSYVTRLFHTISGLLDPRVGRGPFNTFHAHYPFFRCPLDQVFVSSHFRLREFAVSGDFGSDHYAVLADIQAEPWAEHEQDEPDAGAAERAQAEAEIDQAEVQDERTDNDAIANDDEGAGDEGDDAPGERRARGGRVKQAGVTLHPALRCTRRRR